MTFTEACAIAGSREALERIRDRKTIQNWASAKADEPVVPVSALADALLEHWRGKQPKVAAAPPPELDAVLEDVRRLYALRFGERT